MEARVICTNFLMPLVKLSLFTFVENVPYNSKMIIIRLSCNFCYLIIQHVGSRLEPESLDYPALQFYKELLSSCCFFPLWSCLISGESISN